MKRITSLLLALCLAFALVGCASSSSDSAAEEEESAEVTEEAAEAAEEVDEAEEADEVSESAGEENAADSENVNVMVLNGTTGFGMAKLITDAASGDAALNYTFSVETDASNITAALISGTCDIAALPTNAASTIYNKTEGGVQLLALNTLGVLYLVVNGDVMTIESLSDLEGMTVYAPAQNPTYIFEALCQAAGVNVTVDNTYAQPADLRTALAAGEVDVAVLPEPMVTIACSANESLVVALDITEEWDAVYPAGSLVQGCVVARTEFIQENPEAVAAFLEEYEASIAYLSEDISAAAQLVEESGVFTSAAVAEKAIPNCNVCFITGEEMQTAMSGYLEILFELFPDSIGGALPGDDFYYLG
ncbi:MAG: ABC transporter substrate-binding protein [Oscillospiraceae bacterium]|nr:ABC transporter substrate-binding protein [Oscillospiraceae bacterium]